MKPETQKKSLIYKNKKIVQSVRRDLVCGYFYTLLSGIIRLIMISRSKCIVTLLKKHSTIIWVFFFNIQKFFKTWQRCRNVGFLTFDIAHQICASDWSWLDSIPFHRCVCFVKYRESWSSRITPCEKFLRRLKKIWKFCVLKCWKIM